MISKTSPIRITVLQNTGKDLAKADTIIKLKDDRHLVKFDNGFSFWVLTKNNVLEEVSEQWYNSQKKHRITKKYEKQTF